MNFLKKLPGLNKIFEAIAKEKEEKNRQTEATKTADKRFINNSFNLRKLIIEELGPDNCPVEEIVLRLQSVMTDKQFKINYAPRGLFERNPEATQYARANTYTLFMEIAAENASRALPEDAVDFARVLFKNRAFKNLLGGSDMETKRKASKHFFSRGLVPLAAKVNPNDKVKFFHACETEHNLKALTEHNKPEDVATFLYNIFGDMDTSEVNSVIAQSDFMELIPDVGDPEKLAEAFDLYAPRNNPRLAYAFKGHIGHTPDENYRPSFKKHYPDYESKIGDLSL